MRLFIAIAVSLGFTPLVFDEIRPLIDQNQPLTLLRLMVSELLTGALIGLLARVFFVALETIRHGDRHGGRGSAAISAPRSTRRSRCPRSPRC